jgi:hypothetical protein
MIKRSGVFLALAAITMPPNMAAAVPASPQVVNAQATTALPVNINPDLIADKATELSQVLYSRTVVRSQLDSALTVTLPKSMKNTTDYAIYEKEYPGLIAAIVSAIKPAMLKAYDDKMPLLWFNLSQLYRDNFTAGEIAQLHAFYAGPVGVRLMETLRRNSNMDNAMDTAIANGEANAKVAAAVNAQVNEAVRKSNSQISASDKLAIFRFENSLVGRKLTLFNPKAQKAQIDWDFYFTPAQSAEIDQIRTNAIADFIAKADAVKAAGPDTPMQ